MTDQFHTQRTYIGTTAERGTVGGGLGTDGVGILFRDTTLSSWFWWDGTAWDSMGPGGDPHPQYVIISPAASARNVITPTAGTVIPLSIELDAAQSADAFQIRDSGGANILSGADERGILFSDGGSHANNVFLGSNAGRPAATGANNIGMGAFSLANLTSGASNIALGPVALFSCTTGSGNVGLGSNALSLVTTTSSNFALGNFALQVTTGASNVAIGEVSLQNLSIGNQNIAIGGSASLYLTTGSTNVFIGNKAGRGVAASTTGSSNVGIGAEAGLLLTTGGLNVLLGRSAGGQLTVENNKLYIANTNTTTPLLLGDFTAGLTVHSQAAAAVALTVKMAAAASEDALRIVDSVDSTLFKVDFYGGQHIQQDAGVGGTPTPSLTITTALHTAMAAGVERPEIDLDFFATQEWATGALAIQRYIRFPTPPTIAFVGPSIVTDAITMEIGGAPIAGPNCTITRAAALVVASGNVVFGVASVAKTLLTVDGHISLTSNNEVRWYDNGNYVGFEAPALTGDQIWVLPDSDGNEGDALTTDGVGTLSWLSNASEKAWAFSSPTGASGTFYYGGFYNFGATDNDFNPVITHGTANSSYAAHLFLVQAVGAGGGDTTVQVAGTSITDAGVRTAADTENLVVSDAGAAGTYYETTKKWIGQVSLTKTAGPDLLCNYGFCKYWDNNNTAFKVTGIEVTWLGGANDATPNITIRHHSATGWTYNNGAPPTPPAAIADMNTDHVVEIQVVNGENGAWKRDNLSTNIDGGSSEGTIIEVLTSANKTFELGNILLRVVPQ